MDKTIFYRNKKRARTWGYILISIFILVVFFDISSNREKDNAEIRLIFTGDILLSRLVKVEITKTKKSPWTSFDSLFHNADLVIGNLEGAVSPNNHESNNREMLRFDIPSEFISLLTNTGFDILSIENNHACDFGEEGKKMTRACLNNAGINAVDFNHSPLFIRKHNMTISFIALNLVPGQNYSSQKIPSIEVLQKLRLASSLSAMTIVLIHWGDELLEWPNSKQRTVAEWLIQNGSDMIIGTHPHVIQQPEMILGKPVFFSLGNHLFDQKYHNTHTGLIADCSIKNGKLRCEGIVTQLKPNSFYPEIKNTTSFSTLKDVDIGLFEKESTMQLVGSNFEDSNDNAIRIVEYNKGKEIWHSQALPLLDASIAKLDGKADFLITLEKHHSDIDNEILGRPYVYDITNNGLKAVWRGSALAYPLLDAVILSDNQCYLCALHRGDSFIEINQNDTNKRIMTYKWNGFGFSASDNPEIYQKCRSYYEKVQLVNGTK